VTARFVRLSAALITLTSLHLTPDPVMVVIHTSDGCRVDSPYFNVPWSGSYGDDVDECG
jgi:hypothetical protein